jgi:hypothetical protein
MASIMDFTKMRAAALQDGDDEEAVTVNTRALIDKVLARYSGEWTTLRELIQNAADAQATTVTIRFETLPSKEVPLSNTTNQSEILKHVLLNHTLRRLLVTNNGQAFGVNDWARLKRIAEGNPDETKIGAFGVGFYSVFADCEDPFVSSGDKAMAFYWKGNSLFTKRLQLPLEKSNPDTSFVLDYRNTTTPMPNLLSICQFLATSLTFVALEKLELYVDEWKIASLQKKASPSVDVPIAKDVETKTKEGLMNVKGLSRESVQMDATFMNVVGWKPTAAVSKTGNFDNGYGTSNGDVPSLRSFFSRLTSSSTQSQAKIKQMKEEKALQDMVLEDLTAQTTVNVFLRVTTAQVKTSIRSDFAAELERATKKPPPKTTKLAILTSSYDEAAASAKENPVAKSVDIFASVLPGKKPGGRIFIGFPTHQTTGGGMHLSAPSVIPTVERESIDLNARWVRTWNVEMLRVAGIMARLAFASEMADLSAKVKRAAELAGHGTKIRNEEITQFLPEATHILNTFTFGESTPAGKVSQIIEEAFWTCYKRPSIEFYSTRGVLPTSQIRLAIEDLSGFVEGIPVVPKELADTIFVNKLKEFGLIEEITVSDIKESLTSKTLSYSELVQFLTWLAKKAMSEEYDQRSVEAMMQITVGAAQEGEGQGGIIALAEITHYLNVNRIPAEAPIPRTTIPFQLTRSLEVKELQALGWLPLDVVVWLRFLIEDNARRPPEQSLNTAAFGAKVLQILSRAWEDLGEVNKAKVVGLLEPIAIVPTRSGMKKPSEAFFQHVKLFDDLPIVTACPGVKEKFFAAIGVRKTVDLETIFSRLLAPGATEVKGQTRSPNYRHMEVIKYLASVKDDIPAADIEKLKKSQICPAEAGPKGLEPTQGSARLYRVSELFEPKDSLRELEVLPIIQWPGPPGSYRQRSAEGQFLRMLGLRNAPTVPELIQTMGLADVGLREKARNYFIANHHINEYAKFDVSVTTLPILPLQGDEKILVSPAECFTNEKCSVLGFSILKKDLHVHANKFGVAMDPPLNECVRRLIARPPKSKSDAIVVFTYFTSRLNELGSNNTTAIGDAKIVPVPSKVENTANGFPQEKLSQPAGVKHLTPRQCYLGSSSTYGDIFEFVDFGTEANLFLLKCGSKQEPTKVELATLACKEPARLLGIMQTPEKYIDMLRTMADDVSTLRKDRELWKRMKTSQFLLGSIEIPGNKENRKSKLASPAEDGYESDPDDVENAPIRQYKLAFPNQIIVNDDYIGYRLFRGSLVCAPEEEKLEVFYTALGAQPLHHLVQEDLRLGSTTDKQASASKLQRHVLERSKLFLHEYPRSEVKHDSRWLEKNITVQVVSSIKLRRSLKGYNLSHTEQRSAACITERFKGFTLFITEGNYDTYQISQALCRLLLERPNQGAYLTFESFLNLNLYQLRSRGYNVERILRAKAAEQKIAEEERRKQLEAEQAQIKEQEEQWRQQSQVVPAAAARQERRPSSSENAMPGAFGSDSPENSPMPVTRNNRSRGLFSGLKERFGINSSSEGQEQLEKFMGGGSHNHDHQNQNPPPPSYDEANKSGQVSKLKGGAEQVSSPAAVQQNLMNAIQSSRAHDSSTLFSPPTTQNIKEQATYCDTTPATNITFLADASNGTRVFVSKSLASPSAFLSENVSSLNSFAVLLSEVSEIYSLPRKAMHVFYDETGGTIAFNSNGSVFCNFRFWKQLHEKKVQSGRAEGRTDAAAYWWIVVAHELAHNLVKEHNSEHSFYT